MRRGTYKHPEEERGLCAELPSSLRRSEKPLRKEPFSLRREHTSCLYTVSASSAHYGTVVTY